MTDGYNFMLPIIKRAFETGFMNYGIFGFDVGGCHIVKISLFNLVKICCYY